jgi:hypothetical protein
MSRNGVRPNETGEHGKRNNSAKRIEEEEKNVKQFNEWVENWEHAERFR